MLLNACPPVRLLACLIAGGLSLAPVAGWTADIDGSADHPLIPRYGGSEIIAYDQTTFDTYNLFIAPATTYGGLDANLDHTLPLEGLITEIVYRIPEDRTPLEVMRNYELALQELGFEALFQCEAERCGGRNFNHSMPYNMALAENYAEQRFLSARLSDGEAEIYVSLYVTRNTSSGGANAGRTFARLDVIERTAMEINMEVVDRHAMAEEIAATGHVALHAILFEFDSAVLRPEADEQIGEMASYVTANPERTFMVVGHTDNQGAIDYNLGLSQRRAEAVVETLATAHAIDRARLIPVGVGMAAPITTNATEDGRSQNRRVELVVR